MSVLKTYQETLTNRPTSRTFYLDLANKRLGRRTCEGVEAINQAIFIILSVERFDFKIHSYQFGVELKELIGKQRSYIEADIERRLTEALTQDDRITGTSDYSFDFDSDGITVNFTVNTIFADIRIERRFEFGNKIK